MSKTITVFEWRKFNADLVNAEHSLADAKQRLSLSRSEGDLSENAEFDTARKDVAMFSSYIADIKSKLKDATVVDSVLFKLKIAIQNAETVDANILLGNTSADPYDLHNEVNTTDFFGSSRAILKKDKDFSILIQSNSLNDTEIEEYVSSLELGKNLGMVTSKSKLGEHLQRLFEQASRNNIQQSCTFNYIDNLQRRLQCTVELCLTIKAELSE